jgi:amidase
MNDFRASADTLAFLDATAQADLVRRREVTPIELVDAAIARIERLNPTLNAVIHPLFEKARALAASADLPDGPFRGVPFLMKDMFGYTAGDPYHMGLRALRDVGFIAPHDTHLAAKLRRAGLVFLGRTNTPELGTLPTTEPEAYGPSRNPWDTSRTTGGSSGGSAAAVASGMVAAAHANDGGGSIRIPASACGVVGLKPSRGRISLGPDVGEGFGGLVAEGVVSRSVRDTAALLDIVAGPMPGDPYTAPPPPVPFVRALEGRPRRLRVGVLTDTPCGIRPTHPECIAAADDAARLLESLGHAVEVSHPIALDEPDMWQHFTTMYATHHARLHDVLAMLTGTRLGPGDLDAINWTLAEMGRTVSAAQYLFTLDWLHGYGRRMAGWWDDGFDLLVTPTLPEPPPVLGTFAPSGDDPAVAGLRAQQFASFTLPFNMTGQPAISLPLHWSADGGLPVGVQLVGGYGREDLLLQVAAHLEDARPWAQRRPTVSA